MKRGARSKMEPGASTGKRGDGGGRREGGQPGALLGARRQPGRLRTATEQGCASGLAAIARERGRSAEDWGRTCNTGGKYKYSGEANPRQPPGNPVGNPADTRLGQRGHPPPPGGMPSTPQIGLTPPRHVGAKPFPTRAKAVYNNVIAGGRPIAFGLDRPEGIATKVGYPA